MAEKCVFCGRTGTGIIMLGRFHEPNGICKDCLKELKKELANV